MTSNGVGSAKLTINRLVVLEWLSENEPRTGKQMIEKLKVQNSQIPVEYFKCFSKQDVVACVLALADEVEQGRAGVPILHIEAHGYSPTMEAENAIGLGCDGCEALLWSELVGPLRTLNIATKFNLIFVVAACWGDSAIYSVVPKECLPFVLAIGFGTTVKSDRLELAMTQLYQGLMTENRALSESLNLAHQKLDSTGATLNWYSLPKIVKDSAQMAVKAIDEPNYMMDRYMDALSELKKAKAPLISLIQFRIGHLSCAPSAIEKLVGDLLAYEQVPGNRNRFGFDGRAFLREYLNSNSLSTTNDVPIFLIKNNEVNGPHVVSMADVDIQFNVDNEGGLYGVNGRKGGENWSASDAVTLLKANWILIRQALLD